MCKNVKQAQFQSFRVFGDTNVCRADYQDDGHYYHNTDTHWGIHPDDDGGVGVIDINPDAVPICQRYERLLEQERENPPAPKEQKPPHIQRLKSRSKNNQVRFSERYEFDYMGNSYFEQGECAARIRELNDLAAIGRTVIGGFKVIFVYNPRNYNEAGAVETLKKIYDRRQGWWIEEDPYFNRETCNFVVKMLKDRKRWNREFSSIPFHRVDAWFDITYGLFWTIDTINPADILLNFNRSVRHMDAVKTAREWLWDTDEKRGVVSEAGQ